MEVGSSRDRRQWEAVEWMSMMERRERKERRVGVDRLVRKEDREMWDEKGQKVDRAC